MTMLIGECLRLNSYRVCKKGVDVKFYTILFNTLCIVVTLLGASSSGCGSSSGDQVDASARDDSGMSEGDADPDADFSAPDADTGEVGDADLDADSIAADSDAEGLGYPLAFHVRDGRIVDQAERPIILQGFDILVVPLLAEHDPYEHPEWETWSPELFRGMRSWGAEITRIQTHPLDWRDDRDRVIRLLDDSIEWSRQEEMYIYIQYNVSGWPPWEGEDERHRTTRDEFLEFWDTISTQYAENRVVAFYELMNEPTGSDRRAPTVDDWLQWKGFAEEVIDVIRANDPDTPVIVSGLHWSYDISFAEDYPVERPNVIYGVHPYPGQLQYKSFYDAFGRVALQHAVFATEFGYDWLTFVWKVHEVREDLIELMPELDLILSELASCETQICRQAAIDEAGRMIESNSETREYLDRRQRAYEEEVRETLDDAGIGWTAFCFSAERRPRLIADPEFTPTESGAFFMEWLRGSRD